MNKAPPKLSISVRKAATDKTADKAIDLELVKRCRAGDGTAFGKLVGRYQRKVYTVALGMVKNPEDAMDIAQDAFIKVHRYLDNFQGSSSFYTWLYRIVVNLCIDHLRKTGRHMNVDFDERIDHQDNANASLMPSSKGGANPSKEVSRKELGERITSAIEQLPPYHRAVIVMREIDGMSYAEMAKAMNVSKGTIMSRLHHARQKLQRSLDEYVAGELVVR